MGDSPATRAQWRFTGALSAAVLLCALFAVVLGSSLLPRSQRETLSFLGFALGGVAIMVSGSWVARRCHGGRRHAWILLTLAAAVALVGNLWGLADRYGLINSPEEVAETIIAVALVLSIGGLLGLSPVRQRGAQLTLMVLDGLVVACAVLVVTSIVVYSQIFGPDPNVQTPRPTSVLLTLLDVVLVTVALLLIIRSNADRLFFSLIGSGFLLYAVSDLAFAVEDARSGGDYHFGSINDLGWIAGYLLLTAAAWHPHAAEEPDPDRTGSAADVQG